MIINPYAFGGGGGGTACTWNPLEMAADLALSSGNLIVARQATNNASWRTVVGTQSKNSGKRVFAVTSTVHGSPEGWLSGLVPGGFALTNFPGQTATSYGLHSANGRAYNNNAQVGTDLLSTGGTGTHQFAVDFSAGLIWVGQNNFFSGNPGGGTGSRFSFTPGATLFPAVGLYRASQTCQGKFSVADYPYTVPAGFTVWDG